MGLIKYYRWVIVFSLLTSVLFFLFLQFVYYFELTSQHFLLSQNFSLQAHWELFTKIDNLFLLIFCLGLGLLPILLLFIFNKWLYPIFRGK